LEVNRLIDVTTLRSIPPQYRGSPIGRLLEYHNLNRSLDDYNAAQLLIRMCMDHRKRLRLPANFAYIIRSGGGKLQNSEFDVSYAIAIGGVRAIALIGHTQCGMVNLLAKKEQFIRGLVQNAGWEEESAEVHFTNSAALWEIGNEIDFVLSEVKRIRNRYQQILVAPLLYRVEDNRVYVVRES